MEGTKKSLVWITPLRRFRILTNQRSIALAKASQITPEFIAEVASSVDKQVRSTARSAILSALYLAIVYVAYSGSALEVAILGIKFGDVPRLLEISIFLFSISLFYQGVLFLNSETLRESLDSMISIVANDDEIFQGLYKYRSTAFMNYMSPFKRSYARHVETIQPTPLTSVVNGTFLVLAVIIILAVYFVPVIFLLGFAVPAMTTSMVSFGIAALAWLCSVSLLLSLSAVLLPLPYNEYTSEK
jgi:hypothetical protein